MAVALSRQEQTIFWMTADRLLLYMLNRGPNHYHNMAACDDTDSVLSHHSLTQIYF